MRRSHSAARLLSLPLCLLSLLAARASAQQFQQVTAFPGTARWSEGVECADVDHDGDLDLFFADGDGFSSAGTKRQNVLMINKLVETAPWTFADESVARLGVHESNAKGVATGDIDGDGWVDALFANAFSTDTPFLYVNQGVANPGYFDLDSAARGLTAAYSSGGAQFGDLDDDGDLDLIIADAYLGAAAGKPHLFFNDGNGNFTENAAALGASNKSAQMDVQLVDIDGDWDLDFFGDCRAVNAGGNHYLMLNDGGGAFTNQSALIAVGTGSTYEAEAGDLDGDLDLDLFFVSLTGFKEGAVTNNVVPSASLTFTNQAALAAQVDDNEIALIDYDNDQDYDVLVGSLGTHEYLYRNDGSFTFVDQSAQITAVADSTLDCTFADLDNDGKYDLVTVQGESGTFTNRYYKNTGTADTLAPVLTDEEFPASAPAAGPVIVHAKIRDQVLDDGVNYVVAGAEYVINTGPSFALNLIGATGFGPAVMTVAAGTTVTWANNSGGVQTIESTTAPYTFDSGVIAAGQTYHFTFVKPGVYDYQSTPSGFIGQINVVGASTSVAGTASGGQIYRFEFADNAAGLGLELCYELSFTDYPGNVRVTDARCIPLLGAEPGTPFCVADGSDAMLLPCPCANVGAEGNGCGNSINPDGARLTVTGTVSPNTILLTLNGVPNNTLCTFLRTAGSAPTGLSFGDGVSCLSGTLIRFGSQNAVNHSAETGTAGFAAGATRRYQAMYRNPAAGFCTAELFNISNGYVLVW